MIAPKNLLSTLSLVTALAFVATGCGGAAGDDGDSASTGNNDATTSATEALSSANQEAFNFFVGKGLSEVQAAGIVGNFDQESNMSSTVHQYGGGPGRGIAQWSAGGRWDADRDDNVAWYAAKEGQSETSLNLQLEFTWYELTTFSSYGLSRLRAASTVEEATVAFETDFEGCGECDESNRINDAEGALRAFGHGADGKSQPGCYSQTLDKQMPDNACVQSRFDSAWYQCNGGAWTNRFTDPNACDGTYPL